MKLPFLIDSLERVRTERVPLRLNDVRAPSFRFHVIVVTQRVHQRRRGDASLRGFDDHFAQITDSALHDRTNFRI